MPPSSKALEHCPLFSGIGEAERGELLHCLQAREKRVKKDELLFCAGDKPSHVGVVLEGEVYVVQEDYWGNRTLITAIGEGGIFGEAFCCAQAAVLPVSVVAQREGRVLLLDNRHIRAACPDGCAGHRRMLDNLMRLLAEKNVTLTGKIRHMARKTIREKVLSYLSECAVANGKNTFTIPFDRQEMADYLAVDRSALSAVLSKMKQEGIVDYHKNRFKLRE